MNSFSSIMDDAVSNVIQKLKGTNFTIEQVRDELMEELHRLIAIVNDTLPKERRLKYPRDVPEHMISVILMKLYDFVVLCRTTKLVNRMACMVAFYADQGEKEGLYVSNTEDIYRIITQFNRTLSKQGIAQVYDEILREAEVKYVNTDPDLIPLKNGVFNYKTKVLLPFSCDMVFVKKIPINFNPLRNTAPVYTNADGTTWNFDDWLLSLSDDPETAKLLLQICGAVLRPRAGWEQILFLYSPVGRNGKGTFCALLREIAGEGNYASISLKQMTEKFGLSPLLDVSAVITDENSVSTQDIIKDVENVKAVTTGDHFQLEQKYRNPVDFQYRGVVVQCLNNLPQFCDTTSSMIRRMLFVNFPKTFTGCDNKAIKADYLHREDTLEYIVWKVLADMPDYYEFSVPEVSKKLIGIYELETNLVKQFWEEFREKMVWELLPGQFLYDLYKAWAEQDMGVRNVEGKNTFLNSLRRIVDYDDEWEYFPTSVPLPDAFNRKAEYLLGEYNLVKWMNSRYYGADLKVKYQFTRISSISSPFRRVDDANKLEKPFRVA
ncbi:DNA primase family protein [Roseburia inulinivorans]